MNKKIIVLLLLAALVIFGCSRMEGGLTQLNSNDSFPYRLRSATPGLPYDDSVNDERFFLSEETIWRGTGFMPEGAAGIEGHAPPAFRDMSNLYGFLSSSDETDIIATNPNADERKLVKMATVQLKLDNFDTIDEFISNLLERHNAYSALTQINEQSRFYSLRVPSKLFDVFLT